MRIHHDQGNLCHPPHRRVYKMCPRIRSYHKHCIDFFSGQKIVRGRLSRIIVWVAPSEINRIRKSCPPGKYRSCSGNVIMSPHRHKRELRMTIQLPHQPLQRRYVLVLWSSHRHAHPEEYHSEVSVLHLFCKPQQFLLLDSANLFWDALFFSHDDSD